MNIQEIKKAQEEIRSVLQRTPIFTSRYLSDQTGAQVFLKAEMFQKTGSFKPRGTFHKLRTLSPEEKSKGIVSVSAGNYAQAIAFTASTENIPCTVVMPITAPAAKLDATRGYGATVILHDDRKTLFDRTEQVRREKDALFLHPFDDPEEHLSFNDLGVSAGIGLRIGLKKSQSSKVIRVDLAFPLRDETTRFTDADRKGYSISVSSGHIFNAIEALPKLFQLF